MKLEIKVDRESAKALIVLFYQYAIPEKSSILIKDGLATVEAEFDTNDKRSQFVEELNGEVVSFEHRPKSVKTGEKEEPKKVSAETKGEDESKYLSTSEVEAGADEVAEKDTGNEQTSGNDGELEVPAKPDSKSREEETAASETGSDQIDALEEQSQGTGADEDVGGGTFLEQLKSKSADKEQFLNSVAEELFKRGNVQKRFKVFLHDVIDTKAESILKSCETADLGISTVNQGIKKRTGKTTREFFLELIRIYDSWNVEDEISWEMLRDSLKGSPEEKNQQLFDRVEFSEETIKRYGKINGKEPKAILSVMREVCLKVFRGKSPEEATKELTNIERCDFANILHLYAQMNDIKPIRVGEFLELLK